MAKSIQDIFKVNISSDGTGNSSSGAIVSTKTESATTAGKSSEVSRNSNGLVSTFTDAVETLANSVKSVTSTVNSVDCGDLVFEWMKENVPGFQFAAKSLDNISDISGTATGGIHIKSLVGGMSFTKTMCTFITQWYGIIDGLLDVISKGALVLFAKIDGARQRLQAALASFTKTIEHCILDIFGDLKNKLKMSIKASMQFDWGEIQALMETCPCVSKMIASITNCTRDASGTDISNSPSLVIACVKEKLSFMDPATLMVGVDSLVNKYIDEYIKLVFKFIKKWLDYIFNVVIAPFRALIKQYIKMITEKMDVTWLIDKVGVMECFFAYTTEYKKGKQYYGMSVLDMIKTWKQWIPCFENVCPGITEKIRNKVKKLYEDLRLDDVYWRRAYEADLYKAGIADNAGTSTTRDTVLRELYGSSMLDSIATGMISAKNDDDSSPNRVGPTPRPDDFIANPVQDAARFVSAPDNENGVNIGYLPITEAEMQDLKDIMASLGQGEDDYYVEKEYQLLRFAGKYALDDDTAYTLKSILDQHGKQVGGFNDRKSTYVETSEIRDTVIDEDSQYKEKYVVASDYNADRVTRLSVARFRPKAPGESLDTYYAAMYGAYVGT